MLAEAALVPAQEVVGDLIAATGMAPWAARVREPTRTSGSRSLAVVDGVRADREQDVAQLAAPVQEVAKVAPGGAVSRSTRASRTDTSARSASIVIRVSTPKPAATGKQALRAEAVSRRWPESGSDAA